jgi:hypothetical protein
MTTTERIANAIKHILEEDRRADRERIAELERGEARWHIAAIEANALINDLNKQLDEAHKENARLVLDSALDGNDGWRMRSSTRSVNPPPSSRSKARG